jgi:hypothetical protein
MNLLRLAIAADAEEVRWHDRYGDPLPDNISTTKEQAADALNAYRAAKDAAAQEAQDRDLKAAIDNPRIEMSVLDPSTAAKYDMGQEVERAVSEFARDMGVEPPAAPTAEANTQPATPDGLDSQLAFAMSHPQVREAIEVELAGRTRRKRITKLKLRKLITGLAELWSTSFPNSADCRSNSGKMR